MNSNEMNFILEMMPYAMAILSMVLFFLYLTLRMLFRSGRRVEKKNSKKSNKPETLDDRLEEIVRRSGDLQQRISNLEDIVYQEHRSK